MNAIPLHRVATVMPIVRYLGKVGAPVDSALRRAGLPVFALEDPDCFVPSTKYWDFVADASRREGIRNLGYLVGRDSGVNAADSGLTRRFASASNLHEALSHLCRINNRQTSFSRLWLEPLDGGVQRLYYRTSFGREHPAFEQFEWLGLMAVIDCVRMFNGSDWQPEHIGLASRKPPGLEIREAFQNTRFLPDNRYCFLDLESEQLYARRLGLSKRPVDATGSGLPACTATDLPGCLEQVLQSYLRDGSTTISQIAPVLGIGARTLQRRLADENLTFRGMVEATRVRLAIALLDETELSVGNIAAIAGYTDPSHFTRAFRRRLGICPTGYRKAPRRRAHGSSGSASSGRMGDGTDSDSHGPSSDRFQAR